ncbi:MAG: hypothetical protein CV090_14115 [Nitrospira sp. WS238]|nr:hypothetical protein [Nitrospira sp. WS238]
MRAHRVEIPLSGPLHDEAEVLLQESQSRDTGRDDLKQRMRDWFDRVLRYWNFQPKPVLCPTCQTRLDTLYPKGSREDCDLWELEMNGKGPTIIYTCLSCRERVPMPIGVLT